MAADDLGACRALVGMALAREDSSTSEAIDALLLEAEAIAQAQGLDYELAQIYHIRGGQAFFKCEIESSFEHYRKALEFARRLAKRTGTNQKVAFEVAKHEYKVKGFRDPDRPASEYKVQLGDAPYNVSLVSADFGGGTEIEYDGFGLPVGLGEAAGKVVLQAGVETRTVRVGLVTGEAYVE